MPLGEDLMGKNSGPRKDITGNTYGSLIVLGEPEAVNSKYTWLCRCACDTTIRISGSNLVQGQTTSCGCLRWKRGEYAANFKHGLSRTKEYTAWVNMLARCNKKENPEYPNYGARGISVCPTWEDVSVFLSDMGTAPGKEYSLERVDNNLGYSKENCRWATSSEQRRNRRCSVFITIDGVSKTIGEWSAISGVAQKTIGRRWHKGYPEKHCVFAPSHRGSTYTTS